MGFPFLQMQMNWKQTFQMRKVVSNTTPIITLLKIGKLDLLGELYGKVNVPQAVYREIEAGKDRDYYTDVGKLDWIDIVPIKSTSARLFLFDLDDGEAETIILAQELAADIVIIDEKLGRRYAAQINIKVTGTLGILLKAKECGIISTVAPFLHELREKSSWINNSLFEKALHLAGEL